MEKLFDQWEENDDDDLEEDELPPHKRQQKQVDIEELKLKVCLLFSILSLQLQAKNPEDLVRLTKRGQTVMMFVGVVDPSLPGKKDIRPFTEHWTNMWQSALYNNHVDCQVFFDFQFFYHDFQVFIIDDNRAIFMFREGSQAFEAKQYLIKQPQVTEVLHVVDQVDILIAGFIGRDSVSRSRSNTEKHQRGPLVDNRLVSANQIFHCVYYVGILL